MRRIAIYGQGAERAAAALIRSLRAGGASVVVAFADRAAAPASSGDFVSADGRLLPNEVFWLEWASGQALPPDLPSGVATEATLVVVAHSKTAIQDHDFEMIDATTVRVFTDAFGRPGLAPPHGARPASCRIGLLGDPHHHRHVYPAILARMGDAADRTGIAMEPVLMSAADLLANGALDGLHGMILPGGGDMGQVGPQIAVAGGAFTRGMPTLGLCLGMQSMATALVCASVWHDAVLEEVAGPGPCRSFVRMRADDGSDLHRLGDRHFLPKPGTRLATLLPHGAALRMNHRYRFNPDIADELLPQVVLHRSGDIVDAIEVPAHPFFIGLQGHPELGCDPALFPLWDAFVHAATKAPTGPSR